MAELLKGKFDMEQGLEWDSEKEEENKIENLKQERDFGNIE